MARPEILIWFSASGQQPDWPSLDLHSRQAYKAPQNSTQIYTYLDLEGPSAPTNDAKKLLALEIIVVA
jgi:hypothetical protein